MSSAKSQIFGYAIALSGLVWLYVCPPKLSHGGATADNLAAKCNSTSLQWANDTSPKDSVSFHAVFHLDAAQGPALVLSVLVSQARHESKLAA